MTQEDKELLLKDLSARLPYKVICTDLRHGDSIITEIDIIEETVYCDDFDEYVKLDQCKPYLRPMSSMTDKELIEFLEIRGLNINSDELKTFRNGETAIVSTLPLYSRHIDWLNAHHFDYRRLIEKSLAIAITKENNPY